MRQRITRTRAALAAATAATIAVALAVALPPSAHIERDPIFVDPAADESIFPPAGGDFVQRRYLGDPTLRLRHFVRAAVALWQRGIGAAEREELLVRYSRLSQSQQRLARRALFLLRLRTRGGPTLAQLGVTDPRVTAEETLVVCQPTSMRRLVARLSDTQVSESAVRDRFLKRAVFRINLALAQMCRFDEIQDAVNAADNGDTVAIMPGFYTEPTAREAEHGDPRCAELVESGTRDRPAPTFEYHVRCPNDINLILLLGRDLEDNCIRCNVHIRGTGIRPEDVIIEGGEGVRDPGVSDDLFTEGQEQAEGAKEVGLRVERGDGAYVGFLTVRNLTENGLYSIETDGMTFDRIKAYWAEEYTHLSFVTDHLTIKDGDYAGSGDAGIYPGASPPSGARLNSRIFHNRSHHNAIGLSGTMGSSLLIFENEFVNNSTGITFDSLARAGHPGFPQNSTVVRENLIHHNNFDTYGPDAWIESTVQAPIGAGIVLAGGNSNAFAENWIFGNYRYGTVLISVPDAVTNDPQPDDPGMSTSHRNRTIDNRMSMRPDGTQDPNGIDHWWDELGQANCWEDNVGPNGTLVNDPANLPDCQQAPNVGQGNPAKTRMLADCNFVSRGDPDSPTCDWYRVPPKPPDR